MRSFFFLKLKDVTSVRIGFRGFIPGFAKVCLSCCWNKERAISMLVFALQLLVSDPSCFRCSEHPRSLTRGFLIFILWLCCRSPCRLLEPQAAAWYLQKERLFFPDLSVPGFQGSLRLCFMFTSVKAPVSSKGATRTYYKFFTRFLIWGGWKVTVVQGRFHWICIFPEGIEFNDIKNRFFYMYTIYCLVEMEREAIKFCWKEKRIMGLVL